MSRVQRLMILAIGGAHAVVSGLMGSRKRLTIIAIVAAIHVLVSGIVGAVVSVVGMMFLPPDSALVWLTYGVSWVFFFPQALAELAGVSLANPADGGAGLLLNSVCWAAIMCSAWWLCGGVRRAVVRRARRIPVGSS